MFGDPVTSKKGWISKTISEICKDIVDCPHSTPKYISENTGFICIRSSIVKSNRILWDKAEYVSEKDYHKRIQRKRPQRNDIVYTREGGILGVAAIIDRNLNICLGQRIMLLSPNEDLCSPEFLCTAMNFKSFLDKALKGLSGSASPHINVSDIKKFQIILPPLSLQNQFTSFSRVVDKSKLVFQESLDKIEILEKSFMQEDFYKV